MSNITYEPFGPYSGLTNGNGVAEWRGFDQDYRLTGIIDNGSSATLQDLGYVYYPTNNVQTMTNAVASSQTVGSTTTSYGYGSGKRFARDAQCGRRGTQAIGYTADDRIARLNPGIQPLHRGCEISGGLSVSSAPGKVRILMNSTEDWVAVRILNAVMKGKSFLAQPFARQASR